jgi:hypothetical protein
METPAAVPAVPTPAPLASAAAPVPLTAVPAAEAAVPRIKRKYTKRAAKADAPKAKRKYTKRAAKADAPKAKKVKAEKKPKRVAGVKAQGQVSKGCMRFMKGLAKEKDETVGALVGLAVERFAKSQGYNPEA